jgi:hypothetical protein
VNVENIDSTLNFKNDQLLLNVMLNKNILNLYSALVKNTDFHQLKGSHSLCTVPYLCGKNLTKEVRKRLMRLDRKYKARGFLLLRKIFRHYCGEISCQRVTYTKKLLKRSFSKNMFPFTFLRVLVNVSSKGNKNLEEKIILRFILLSDYVTSFYKPRPITLSKTLDEIGDKRLWYFIGVCVGDGSLLAKYNDWRLEISDGSPHIKELEKCKEYLKKIESLAEKIFKIKLSKSSIKKQKGNWFNLRIGNKWLVRYLNFFFGLPVGNKIGKLSTPKILDLMKNKKMLERYFWRGIFDTDGMINRKSRNIVLASSDSNLMKQCEEFLIKCGIKSKVGNKKDKYGNLYKLLEIDSDYIKDFAIHVETSHPLKQDILMKHLQKPLKYYTFQGLNKRNMREDGKFDLSILKNKDKRVSVPECPSTELLKIACCISVIDWEGKRVIFKTGIDPDIFNFKKILTNFETIFGIKPKFLPTRNMWYVNSQLLNEFFRKFFIYDLPWKPLSKEKVKRLLKNWNDIYAI